MQTKVKPAPLISIIVPAYNEEDNVSVLFDAVQKYLAGQSFEILYIDDGSSDATLKNLEKLATQHPEVKYIGFSRNFGHQSALRAGLKYAEGSAVISMDADLQHPPELLPQLLKEWRNGYDVVYTIRKDNQETSGFKRGSSIWFYKVMNYLSGLQMDEGAADFRLLDRRIVDVINNQEESELFLRGYISWLGFKQLGIPYEPARRFSGQSKYTFKKMFSFAIHGITQFSIKPLRLSIVTGFGFALFGACYGIYVLLSYIISNHVAQGWTSLSILVLITSGIQLILLGIVGEYVGKTFLQTKHRPDYLIRDTNITKQMD